MRDLIAKLEADLAEKEAQRKAHEISSNRYRDITHNFQDDVHFLQESLRKIIDSGEIEEAHRIAQAALNRCDAALGKPRDYTREELGRERKAPAEEDARG